MRTRVAVVCTLLLLGTMIANAGDPPERFRGWVIATGGAHPGKRIQIVIHAESVTSDETIHELAGVLVKQGENALLHKVEQLPSAGWIEIGGAYRTELKAVRSVGGGPVRQLRFLTTPAIRYDDLLVMTRSPDFNYGFVELVVDENGEGDGTITPAAAIVISDHQIRIAGLGSYAFRILDVGPEEVQDNGKAEEHPQE